MSFLAQVLPRFHRTRRWCTDAWGPRQRWSAYLDRLPASYIKGPEPVICRSYNVAVKMSIIFLIRFTGAQPDKKIVENRWKNQWKSMKLKKSMVFSTKFCRSSNLTSPKTIVFWRLCWEKNVGEKSFKGVARISEWSSCNKKVQKIFQRSSSVVAHVSVIEFDFTFLLPVFVDKEFFVSF